MFQGGYPWTYLDPVEPKVCVGEGVSSSEALTTENLSESRKFPENDDSIEESQNQLVKKEISYALSSTDTPVDDSKVVEEIATSKIIASNRAPVKSEAAKATEILKGILKRAHPQKKLDISKASGTSHASQSIESTSPQKIKCCHPLVDKLKTMADKQYHKGKRNIKKYALRGDDAKIVLQEEQKILNLKESPRAERKQFASYVVKQDSDDVLDIVQMDESPTEVRKRRDEEQEERTTIVVPDEIIDLPPNGLGNCGDTDAVSIEPTINELLEEEFKSNPPKKAPRKLKDHHYEDIDDDDQDPLIQDFIQHLSLKKEDENVINEIKNSAQLRPISSIDSTESEDEHKLIQKNSLLAPISSIDSASSDDERKINLTAVSEEDDAALNIVLEIREPTDEIVKRSNLKRETSPNAEKKVTFSPSTEDEPVDEPHREDVDLPNQLKIIDNRWSKMRYVNNMYFFL